MMIFNHEFACDVIMILACRYLYVFFFQAEDGIRDHCVTGVQTCALPISTNQQLRIENRKSGIEFCIFEGFRRAFGIIGLDLARMEPAHMRQNSLRMPPDGNQFSRDRSEERRVGKECRCGWATAHYKKHK